MTLQLALKGKTRTIPIGLRLQPDQWNGKTITNKVRNYKRKQSRLETLVAKAQMYLKSHPLEIQAMSISELKTEIVIAINRNATTSENVENKLRYSQSNEGTLQRWGQVLIDRAIASNRIGKASYYKPSISAFIKFNKGKDLPLIDINEQFLEEFKVYAMSEIEGVKKRWKPNSTGAYMRAVRAIINQSIKEKRNYVPHDFQPFKNIGIPSETKEVDSITATDIGKLRNLDIPTGSNLWKARARFLFMFNCQGMNFVDLANLRVRDKVGQFISYERAKTIHKRKNKRIDVALTQEALSIWNFFTEGKGPKDFAFDIYEVGKTNQSIARINARTKSNQPEVTMRNRRIRALKKQNVNLKLLSDMCGLHKKMTTYDARYGWVNSALDAKVSEDIIGKGLGHSHPGVTRVYFEERHKRSLISTDLNELITQGQ